MHPLFQTMVLTVLVPAASAALLMLGAVLAPPGHGRNAMAALGLAFGWCAGVWWAVRVPHWPPAQAADWQFYVVVVAAALVLAAPLWRGRWRWRWLAAFAFGIVFFAVLLQRVLAGWWPGLGAWIWPAGLAGLAVANAAAVERVGHSVQAAWTLFGLTAFAVAVSVALALGGSAALGHMAGIMAAAGGAMWLVSWVFRRQVGFAAVAFVAALILGGLLAQGVLIAGLKPGAALLLAAGWPMAAAGAWVCRHGSGRVRATAVLGLLLLPAAISLWLLGPS